LDGFSKVFYRQIDRLGIDRLVNGVGDFFVLAGRGIRQIQTGHVGFYIFMMVIGVIAIMLYGMLHV
jgi:NADH-quinone oxidoreductase subunit L